MIKKKLKHIQKLVDSQIFDSPGGLQGIGISSKFINLGWFFGDYSQIWLIYLVCIWFDWFSSKKNTQFS